MSESYFDIKITSGIEPKGEDSDFPILKSHHVETAQDQRLDAKLNAIDNQFALDNQKIDAESARLDSKIENTANVVNSRVDTVEITIATVDGKVDQEVTDRISFGHAVNNEFVKINRQLETITENTSGIDNKIESVKVESKNYADSKVTAEELARQQAISNEASARSVADSNLQAQLNNKVGTEAYNNDKAATNESIRTINNKLTAIPSTYATIAEVDGVKNEFQGKLDNKLDEVTFDAYKSEADSELNETNNTVSSLQQTVNGIAQDYLKASDKAELQAAIATVEGKIDESVADVLAGVVSDVEELSNVVTGNKEAVDAALEGKLDKSTYENEKTEFALKNEIPSVDNLATKDELESDVAELESALSQKVETSTYEDALTTIDNKIKTAQDTAQTNAVNNAKKELKPLISANSEAIELKADKSELSNYATVTSLISKQDTVVFTSDTIVSTSLGGLDVGTNLKGMTISDILRTILSANIAVTGILLSTTSLNLQAGKTAQLSATIQPSDATNKDVVWEIVSGDGITLSATSGSTITVTAGASAASATILAKSAENTSITASCSVTVAVEIDPITDIKENELAIQIGTSGSESASEFKLLTAEEAADPANQGFFEFDDRSGYQVIQPSTGRAQLGISIPSSVQLVGLEYYNPLTSAWEAWLPDANPKWTVSGTTTIDGVSYTNYEINAKGTGLSVRFIIE